MKKILLTVLFLTSSLFAELDWASSYEQGLVKAKKEHKVVMLMFSSKTCKMCNYMKKTVYENDDVMEYVGNFFIPIEVDVQAHPDKYGYQVIGTPTYYFLTSDGKQIGRMMMGGATPEGFLQKLKEVKQGQ
ncbi:MAG: thioredoxin family protein [Sulfuricurvum sp.]|uniref:thioredoxin family protein n=1 Tax=Sulfuricurvum sp. TaxID=2025608 RepID=UPI00262518FE|nr:thioredoxin family protein [Sulfuricurvum sp.]MDD5161093.1 thioredoxin family protein [Sulfuricurvum sp.]